MARARILVLYEDARARDRRERTRAAYPLHHLVLRCMEDRFRCRDRGLDFKELKADIEAHPRKGIGNLLGDLKRGVWHLHAAPVFALVDDDRGVREHLGLTSDVSWDDVLGAIKEQTGWAEVKERVFGLCRNLESLLRDAAAVGSGCEGHETVLAVAEGRKDRNQRDKALQIIGYRWPPEGRERLLERQPGLSKLVDALMQESARADPGKVRG